MAPSGTAATRVKRGSALPVGPLTAAITLGAVGTMAVDTARDPDLFWHVRTGQWIWAHHAVPRADPFSWTVPGRKWIAHEWLTEAVYATLHSAFGWAGISLISALIIVGGWMLVRSTCLKLGAGAMAASVATLLAAISSLHTWGTRPQMVSLLFTALFAWLLAHAASGNARRLWLAPPVMLLWANLHGGYIFGIAMLWAYAASVLAELVLTKAAVGRRVLAQRTVAPVSPALLGTGVAVAASATLVTLANPNGIEGFTYPFSYLGSNASTKYVLEWFAPDFTRAQYWPFAIVAALCVVTVVRHARRIPLHLFAVGIPFAFLAFQSVRNITQFAIISAPLLGTLFSRTGVRPADNAALGDDRGKRVRPQTLSDDRKAAAIVFAMIGGAMIVATAPTLTASANARVQARDFPVEATRELAKINATAPVRIFNQYDWGGYLAFAAPELKVFIDGRPDMYGDRFVDRYMSTWWLKPGWKERLDEDRVDTVIAGRTSGIVVELTKDDAWKLVYSDPVASILQRR